MKNSMISLGILAAFLVTSCVMAEDSTTTTAGREAVKTQTLCPVMNSAINRSLFVDHAGKRIYVCCRGCLGVVKADPEKYIQQLEAAGVTLDKTPADETK